MVPKSFQKGVRHRLEIVGGPNIEKFVLAMIYRRISTSFEVGITVKGGPYKPNETITLKCGVIRVGELPHGGANWEIKVKQGTDRTNLEAYLIGEFNSHERTGWLEEVGSDPTD